MPQIFSNGANGLVCPVVSRDVMDLDPKRDLGWKLVRDNRLPPLEEQHPLLKVVWGFVKY